MKEKEVARAGVRDAADESGLSGARGVGDWAFVRSLDGRTPGTRRLAWLPLAGC